MDVFDYLADSSPDSCESVIKSFGYRTSSDNLPQGLRDLVSYEGEDALKRLMNIHPDRDILIYYNKLSIPEKPKHNFNPANMNKSNDNIMLIFLMGATLLVAAAIITK